MSTKKNFSAKIVILTLLGLIVSIKMIFTGLFPDEEYQLTMAYRLATGDGLFHYSWDTIQTSGFAAALLTKIYLLFHSTDSLVIFQRVCGVIIQLIISSFFYRFLTTIIDKSRAAIIAFALFAFFPKMIASAEFANMLQWFTISMLIILGPASREYLSNKKLPIVSIIISAFLFCGAILCQACFILIPIMMLSLCLLFPGKKFLSNLIFWATCLVTGSAYVIPLVLKYGISGFVTNMVNVLNGDMTHASGANTMGESILISFIKNSIRISILLTMVFASSFVICLLVAKIKKSRITWAQVKLPAIIISGAYTLCQWLILRSGYDGLKLFIPTCIICALADCIIVFHKKTSDRKAYLLPFIGLLISIGVFINVLMVSNVPMINNLSFLSTGVIWSLVILSLANNDSQNENLFTTISVTAVAAVIFVGTLFTLPSSPAGNTVFACSSRIENGPAKNIYTSKKVASTYTEATNEFREMVPAGSNVLIVSNSFENTLLNYCYLLNDVNISHYSVNSTPTFSQKLEEFWIKYPEKTPDVVIFNNSTYSSWEFDWIRIYTEYYLTYNHRESLDVLDIYYCP